MDDQEMDPDYGMPSYPAPGRTEQPMHATSSRRGWVAAIAIIGATILLAGGLVLGLVIWGLTLLAG